MIRKRHDSVNEGNAGVNICMPVALVQIMDGLTILASIMRYRRAQWKSLTDFLSGESGKVRTSWISLFPNTCQWSKKSIVVVVPRCTAKVVCSFAAIPDRRDIAAGSLLTFWKL
jgi:hypothetical protein